MELERQRHHRWGLCPRRGPRRWMSPWRGPWSGCAAPMAPGGPASSSRRKTSPKAAPRRRAAPPHPSCSSAAAPTDQPMCMLLLASVLTYWQQDVTPCQSLNLLLNPSSCACHSDWCNLDRCKRVKPFRCGELDFEQRITNALTLAATGNRSTWSYNKGRYARMEDAILQALDIEKERALGSKTKAYLHAASCSPSPKTEMTNGQVKDATAKDASPTIQPSPLLLPLPLPPLPPKRKRKTPYDSEDDAPKGSRRMRDLRDIGSKTVPPMDLVNAAAISATKYDDLPNDGQVKRIVHSQATTKRKHADTHQDQPCGIPRKKDRSRPLSELCNGDMWNGSRPNGQKADEHLLGVATCSSSSSGTSTLDTPLDTNSCHRSAAFKTDQAKGTEISCMTRLLSDDSRHGNDFVETPPAAQKILESGNLLFYFVFSGSDFFDSSTMSSNNGNHHLCWLARCMSIGVRLFMFNFNRLILEDAQHFILR